MTILCQWCSAECEGKLGKKFCSKKCADKDYGHKHKSEKSIYDKEYRLKNIEKKDAYRIAWRKANKEKRYMSDRRRFLMDPKLKYYKNILTLLKRFLSEGYKYSKTMEYLPFTLEDLRNRLVQTMPPGYSFEDYFSAKLHIDHIKPHKEFNYAHHSDEEFKKCWDLSNLRLLPKEINISSIKRAEYDKRN